MLTILFFFPKIFLDIYSIKIDNLKIVAIMKIDIINRKKINSWLRFPWICIFSGNLLSTVL